MKMRNCGGWESEEWSLKIRGVEDENQGEWRLRIRKCGGRESGGMEADKQRSGGWGLWGMEDENQEDWRMRIRENGGWEWGSIDKQTGSTYNITKGFSWLLLPEMTHNSLFLRSEV